MAKLAQGSTDEESIRSILHDFTKAWNTKDLEGIAAIYTDPHLDLNAPDAIMTNSELTRELTRYFEQFDTTISVTSDEVIVMDDWAVQRGEFVLHSTPKTGGPASDVKRRYVELLRRDSQGNWRVFWGIDGPSKYGVPEDEPQP